MSASFETELKISCVTHVTNKIIEDLKMATDLKKIIFTFPIKSINELVSALTSNEYLQDVLEEIEYSSQRCHDHILSMICDYIKKCKNIKCINFSFTRVSSDNLIKLVDIVEKCTTLRSLILNEIYSPDNHSSFSYLLDSIIGNIHIQHLSLYIDSALSDDLYDKMTKIVSCNSNLISLSISCKNDKIDIIDAIANNKTIEKLQLFACFDNNFIDKFSEMLKNNISLKELLLHVVGSNCIQSIATALQSNSSLTSLYIIYESIDSNDMIAIANMISNNDVLHNLDISCIILNEDHRYMQFFDIFEDAIRNNYTLQYFNVLDECEYAIECFERNKQFLEKRRFVTTKCVKPTINII